MTDPDNEQFVPASKLARSLAAMIDATLLSILPIASSILTFQVLPFELWVKSTGSSVLVFMGDGLFVLPFILELIPVTKLILSNPATACSGGG